MLPTRGPPQDRRPTQTESEGMDTNFPSKWTGKKSRGSNIPIRLNKLQVKGHKERILKAAREKQEVTYKGAPIRLAADFSRETLQARGNGKKYSK